MIWTNRLMDHMAQFLKRTTAHQSNILAGFTTKEDRQQAMIEYFLLSSNQQVALARFLTKPEYTHSYLLCLGYIASCMVRDKEYLKTVSVESAISDCLALFGESMPAAIDTEQVLSLLSIPQFQESLGMTKKHIVPYFRPHSWETIHLCAFAIANNTSVWSKEKSASEIFIEEHLLGFYSYEALEVCSPKQIEGLIDDWLNPANIENHNEEDYLLFHTLVSYPLNSKYIARICDHLFRDNSFTAVEAMDLLQDDYPNKKAIKKYIALRDKEDVL